LNDVSHSRFADTAKSRMPEPGMAQRSSGTLAAFSDSLKTNDVIYRAAVIFLLLALVAAALLFLRYRAETNTLAAGAVILLLAVASCLAARQWDTRRAFEEAARRSESKIGELNRRLVREHAAREDLNRELEALSYSVSHDLRAPLRAIDGFAQALSEDYAGQLDEAAQGYLIRVRQAAQRMGTLIDDLLSVSRVARTELNTQVVDLTTLAEETASELAQSDPQREVKIEIAQGLRAKGDLRLIRRVVVNLMSNAWKFTKDRAPARIEFGCELQSDEPVYFMRDNGAGFDMTYAGKLFGVFQRLHDAAAFPGTGIGLATAQRVIHRHGGRIWAQAELDRGATFYFTLPQEEPDDG